jgi:ribulose-phosphate 3-epimerase
VIIAASLMCADFWELGRHIGEMEAAGIDALHFDVMDAVFVPNLGVGPQVFRDVRRRSRLPCDVHLMVSRPAIAIPLYEGAGWITIHAEAEARETRRLLADIARRGARPGLALNPETPPETLIPFLDDVQTVLVMTVHPGFAGRPFIPAMVHKVAAVRTLLDERRRHDVVVSVDGNINPSTIPALAGAGAGMFVCGSSGLFIPGKSLAEAAVDLRRSAPGGHTDS